MSTHSSVADPLHVDVGGAKSPHVLVVPFPAQGHTTPSLSIAHFLAASGILATLVHPGMMHINGTHAHVRAPAAAPHHIPPKLRMEVIPSTLDCSQPISMTSLMASIDAMRREFTKLLQKLMLEENAPTCLLIDSVFGWGNAVAFEFGLSWVDLWTTSASVFCLGYHVPDLVARGFIPVTEEGAKDKIVDFIPGLSPFRIADMPDDLIAGHEEGLQSARFCFFSSLFQHAKLADRILVNTIYELEKSAVEALHTEDHVHIQTVGPLFMMSMAPMSSISVSLLQEDNSCLSWLDQQPESSVLYIAFGSLVSIDEDVLAELAHGLEASGESFLWVIRPDGFKKKASLKESLPVGFMERTCDRGLVISWAPQLTVLGHPSVGAFLTHCGWNSVLESLSNGVPMLGFPQMADQNTNLKLVVHEWKVGLPLILHEEVETRKVERNSVQRAVTAFMRGEEGIRARTRARELKEIAEKASHGSSKASLQKLVDDLKNGLLRHT